MTEKVKVSRELATAIETALEYCGGKNDVLQEHIDTWSDDCIPLNSLSFLELAEILVNGYEVELAPEEKFNYYYDKYSKSDIQFEKDFLGGMLAVAEWFKLDVKGVNE